MSKTAKEVVKSFYQTDLIHNIEAFSEYLHPEVELNWNSSFGYNKKGYEDIKTMFKEMSSSFETFKCEISHLLEENGMVTIRYTYLAKTIEQPDTEEVIAHFIAIWELKDDKLYRGYQISQQGDTSQENLKSFLTS
ncbi:nuclear transport factor 2 family protein [uncultured Aquimarina sp.]|uniref:nuclear transport factor 2 family protein n=1 Tax=uncultured Aquimarina sp. TaxID=575652 RepID=UPI00262D2F74|nr:nuclear transport factor 2 family protein [uncultured Aquimarina sp.]